MSQPSSFAVALPRLTPGKIGLLGLPSDENSSFLRGPAQAPPKIREALFSDSSNLTTERGLDLGLELDGPELGGPKLGDSGSSSPGGRIVDLGDLNLENSDLGNLELGAGEVTRRAIEEAVDAVLATGARPLSLGGDHAVTYPVLRAVGRRFEGLTVLHLDAHSDLYDELDGNRYSHACPFARALEDGVVRRLVQVGVRTLNEHQRRQAERFGVEIVDMRAFHSGGDPLGVLATLEAPLYLSLDLDVLDPAFAPGISHYEPGGLSTRELLGLIAALETPLVGADIVELNPTRDLNGMTAYVAAKCLKEIAAHMLEGG